MMRNRRKNGIGKGQKKGVNVNCGRERGFGYSIVLPRIKRNINCNTDLSFSNPYVDSCHSIYPFTSIIKKKKNIY